MDLIQENEENPMKIRLKFSIRNGIKSFYYSVIFQIKEDDVNNSNNNYSTKFETDQIKCRQDGTLIEFKDNFCCDYYFYKVQKIKIQVKKLKNMGESFLKYFTIENNTLDLSTIISSKNGLFQTAIDDSYNPYNELREILMIKVENDYEIDNNISIRKNNFIDYIISGISLKCFICMDFSDKELLDTNQYSNQYLNSILGFRETLYNFTRKFEVYGFDYVLKNKKENELFLNLDKDNEELVGYTNITYAYYQFFNRLDLSDKAIKKEKKDKLSPLIKYLSDKIYGKKNSYEYNIIFILINSLNEEQFQDCIDYFIKASILPISFVVIGIGNDENKFINMKNLCDIKKILRGNLVRDNTFFVSMKECEYKSDVIKNKCLKKIPGQICEFYERNNISLNEIKNLSQDNKNSIKIFDTYNSLIIPPESKEKNYYPAPSSGIDNIQQQNVIHDEEPKNEITPEDDKSNINIDINIDTNKHKKNKNNSPNKLRKSGSSKKKHLSASKKFEGNKGRIGEKIKNNNS